MILHHLQQDLDCLLPVVALVIRAIEVVGLIDEQHPAHRLLENLLRLGRGVPDVLADQIVARHRDQVPLADIAQPVQDVGHPHRDGGLAGTGIAGEAHVQCRCGLRQAESLPRSVHDEERRSLADALFDRLEPDQFPVELVEHLSDSGVTEITREVDGRRRRRYCLAFIHQYSVVMVTFTVRPRTSVRVILKVGSTAGRLTMKLSRTVSNPRVESKALMRM